MNKIMFKDIPDFEKPRERLLKYGVNNLSNEDLIAIILNTGTKNINVKELALLLLSDLKSITDLKNLSINKLIGIKGIGEVKAISLIASIELGKRICETSQNMMRKKFNNPGDIAKYFYDIYQDKQQEEFYVVYLDTKKHYIDKKLIFIGTINMSIVHPREIFKQAYLLSASSIICLHNHPTGDITPSENDLIVTKQIKAIGELHGVKLIDHLIIGNKEYYSFYENNGLNFKKGNN